MNYFGLVNSILRHEGHFLRFMRWALSLYRALEYGNILLHSARNERR